MSTEKTIDEKIHALKEVLKRYDFYYNDGWKIPEERAVLIFHNRKTYELTDRAIDEVKKIEPKIEWQVGLHENDDTLCLHIRILIRGQK